MNLRRPFRLSSNLGVILTFATGILLAAAVLTMLAASLRDPLRCIDPQRCLALLDASYIEGGTADLRTPVELREEAFRRLVRIGMALALMVLGVVAVNLATRLGARALARRKVFALRAVLGATPKHLLRPLAEETGSITLFGVLVGTALGAGAAWLLRRSWPLGPPPWETPSGGTLVLALAAAVLLAILVTVITVSPASVGWHRDLRRHLVTGERATSSPTEGLVREGLAVLQVGCSLLLIVTASLLLAAFLPAEDSAGRAGGDHGELLASAGLTLIGRDGSPAPSRAAVASALERIRGLPGVTDTSLTTEGAPMGNGVEDRVTALCAECRLGSLPKQQTSAPAQIHGVTPGFFRMLGLELVGGRDLSGVDTHGAPRVAVVSRAFALRFFPGGDPIGKEVRLGELPGLWFTVVGVVEDLSGRGLGSSSSWEPVLYLSTMQLPLASSRVLVEVDPQHEPAEVLAMATAAVERLLPNAALGEWTNYKELIERERAPLRWFGALFGLLAAAVTLLATIGLYDVMTNTVATRRREIGVRMAIGADEVAVFRMVVGRCCRLVAIGCVVGAIPLGGLARLLQLRYEGVDPWNPHLALAVTGLLLGIAIIASVRAARAATRIDPLAAMRG